MGCRRSQINIDVVTIVRPPAMVTHHDITVVCGVENLTSTGNSREKMKTRTMPSTFMNTCGHPCYEKFISDVYISCANGDERGEERE